MKKFIGRVKNLCQIGIGVVIMLVALIFAYALVHEIYDFFARSWNLDDWAIVVSGTITLAFFGPLMIHEEILRRRARRSSRAGTGSG